MPTFIKAFTKQTYIALCVACLLVVLVLWQTAITLPPESLRVVMFDIGQGDAIFIETPDGIQVLVDAGKGDAVLEELAKEIGMFDRYIDVAIVTNPDADHFGGFTPVFKKYRVGLLVDSGMVAAGDMYEAFARAASSSVSIRHTARRGHVLHLGASTTLTFLYPDHIDGLSDNDGSLVARLDYASTSLLLTGDTTKKIEAILLAHDSPLLNVDILKVAHHGSKTSTSAEFVDAVSPTIALISAGKNNSYGHPHADVLSVLQNRGVRVLGTYDVGTIVLQSDGEQWEQE